MQECAEIRRFNECGRLAYAEWAKARSYQANDPGPARTTLPSARPVSERSIGRQRLSDELQRLPRKCLQRSVTIRSRRISLIRLKCPSPSDFSQSNTSVSMRSEICVFMGR